jgi:hypothetical protein
MERPGVDNQPKLTPEQVASIPDLKARLVRNSLVAEELGVSEMTIRYHLKRVPEEVNDRIRESRRVFVVEGSLKAIALCITKILKVGSIEDMTIHQAVGCFKVLAGEYRAFTQPKDGGKGGLGGFDAADKWAADAAIQSYRAMIELAVKAGDLSVLQQFVTEPAESVCDPEPSEMPAG